MKLVVFSDLYPPLVVGGYELGAARVVAELRRRGHEVLVLSAHGYFADGPGGFTHRGRPVGERSAVVDVGLCVFGSLVALWRAGGRRFVAEVVATVRARRRYRAAVARFAPGAILAFNPLGVAAPVLDDLAEYGRRARVPVSAFVSDGWLSTWPSASPVAPVLERLERSRGGRALGRAIRWLGLAPEPRPRLDRFVYCSEYLRRASRGNAAAAAEHAVVHWGVEASEVTVAPGHFAGDGPLTLLFAGRLVEEKGPAVLLEALARCRRPHRAVLVGDDTTPHAAACRALAERLGVGGRVTFTGARPHGEVLGLLAGSGQVLVVPSVWQEPFSLVVLEGMSLGLAVVASDTGGTGEAIADGETGLLVPGGDAAALAGAIDRLEADRGLCAAVGARAREAARGRFTIGRMVDRLLALVSEPVR